MKKNILLILLITLVSILSANITYTQERGNLIVNYSNDNLDLNQQQIFGTVLAVPATEVAVEIYSSSYEIFDVDNNYLRTENSRNADCAQIVDSFVMRELYGHKVEIEVVRKDRDEIAVLKNLEFAVIPTKSVEAPTTISPAFAPVYRSITGNYAESYLYLAEIKPSRMLIIAKSNLFDSLEPFMAWKNACGIQTDLVSIADAGATSANIKDYVADQYNNEATKPDYLLLVGDVDGPFELPAFYVGPDNNVTDVLFALIEGEDYFPEIITGRFSIDTELELITIISKILYYEKTPYMDEPEWLNSACLVAGNYSSTPPTPTTPVETSRWLNEKLLEYGYQSVDEFYYPEIYPGTQEIINSINSGVNLVTYRGWGNANGWHFPEFKRQHINELNNGVMLPVVTSFVCNTGDYANIAVDPCFGEEFLRAGTPSNPKGAVIFVGPSDLHTSTRYNNSMFSGFYHGLIDEGNNTFGTALLRGKYELYDNFPDARDVSIADKGVEFYFYVYNILGDPSLVMRTQIPENISCDLVSEISLGTNYLDLNVSGFEGAIISAVKDGEIIDTAINEAGGTTLYFSPQTAGEIEVTITHPNCIPFIQTVDVVANEVDLGISQVVLEADVFEHIYIDVQNYGTLASESLVAELTSSNPFVTIISSNADLDAIAPGNTQALEFEIDIDPACPNDEIMEFSLDVGNICKFAFPNSSIQFEVESFIVDGNGVLDPGDVANVTISLKNIANLDATGITATAVVLSDAIVVSETEMNFGNIAVGANGEADLGISVLENCYVGRLVSIRLDIQDEEGQSCYAIYTTEIGIPDSTNPTGHDNHGYYAYDSNDTAYDEVPAYQWHDVDPNYGGEGEVLLLSDDESQFIDLPFSFQYYGDNYSSITVCTNGWIAFDETEMTDFTNWNIPAALGPYGMVAGYWDDIVGLLIDPDHNVHADVRVSYDYFAAENAFVLQWNEAFNSDNDISVIKFEIVLYDPAYVNTTTGDGVIQVNYHTIDNPDMGGNFATVGIENHSQTDGLLYTYANTYAASSSSLTNELAIKFTTTSPDGLVNADDDETASVELELLGNYPNPFNPTTTISFATSEKSQNVKLNIYNIKGQVVKTLVDSELPVGKHSVVWNGDDDSKNPVSSGVYFYKLSDDEDNVITGKCLLLK